MLNFIVGRTPIRAEFGKSPLDIRGVDSDCGSNIQCVPRSEVPHPLRNHERDNQKDPNS